MNTVVMNTVVMNLSLNCHDKLIMDDYNVGYNDATTIE